MGRVIRCTRCDNRKNVEEFGADKRTKTGRVTVCNECRQRQQEVRWTTDPEARDRYLRYQRAYNRKNKAKRNQNSREYYVKNEFKVYLQKISNLLGRVITKEEYWKLYDKQGGVCAICKQPETLTFRGKTRRLHVDHCHTLFCLRGLLCSACNMGIGKFGDDPDRLRAAAGYLDAASQKMDLETGGNRRVRRHT